MIWETGEIPTEWQEAIIVPIYKAGDYNKAENYRGISLLNTAYKILAMIVNERLTKWAEEGEVLPENQAGFRKGRGTRENIFILHSLVEKQLRRKRGKLYAYFVDLRQRLIWWIG